MKIRRALTVSTFALCVSLASPALAQSDCIETKSGALLCGKDAEAEKQRILAQLAESQGSKPGMPSAAAGKHRRGSVYSAYSRRAFLRGGSAFAGGGSDFGDNFSISGGAGFDLAYPGLSVETEIIALRDKETVAVPSSGIVTTKALALAGLISLRYDLVTDVGLNPFASFGIGPGYVRATLDNGVTSASSDDITFAYSGRAGVSVDFSERLGLEAAYRYVDTSQNGFAGQHLVELGLNLGF